MMGRHDFTLAGSSPRNALAAGFYASTAVRTAFGWTPAAALGPGDLVMTRDMGLVPVISIRTEPRQALWSVRIPAGAFDNADPVMLPPGQPLMVQTDWAMPFSGDDLALVPATALEGWRGIAPHVPAQPEAIVQITLDHASILSIGPGLFAGCDGMDDTVFDLHRLMQFPRRPILPLAAARHMMAQLVADEACEAIRALQAADLRPPPNLS